VKSQFEGGLADQAGLRFFRVLTFSLLLWPAREKGSPPSGLTRGGLVKRVTSVRERGKGDQNGNNNKTNYKSKMTFGLLRRSLLLACARESTRTVPSGVQAMQEGTESVSSQKTATS